VHTLTRSFDTPPGGLERSTAFVGRFDHLGDAQMEGTIQTPTLDIGYVEHGDASGVPIVLLHGFPDDVHAYDEVVPPLAAAGHRVLVPYVRGYGRTRFRDSGTPRLAEQAAIGQDVIDFADVLQLQRFVVCGYDWGGRAACIAAALHPERVRAAVIIGGYAIQDVFSPPFRSRLGSKPRSGTSGISTPSAAGSG
jgi:pimeloyl-ACP methyl ester carboxylesterase